MDPREIAEIVVIALTILSALTTGAAFVFKPRLETWMRKTVESTLGGRLGEVESRMETLEAGMTSLQQGEARADVALRGAVAEFSKVGDRLTQAIERIAERQEVAVLEHGKTASAVARIEGFIKGQGGGL
jgi:hypothetical protein